MIQANKYKGKGIMRKLLIYLNEYRKECILAPLFKLVGSEMCIRDSIKQVLYF